MQSVRYYCQTLSKIVLTCPKAGRSIFQPFLPELRLSEGRIKVGKIFSVVNMPVIILSEDICVTSHRVTSIIHLHASSNLILLRKGH